MASFEDHTETLKPLRSEQFLIELLERGKIGSQIGNSAILWSFGRAQLAASLAQHRCGVDCLFHDLYQSRIASTLLNKVSEPIRVHCAPDPTKQNYALALLPLTARGDAELARDLVQSFYISLTINGELWVSVDNPRDTFVRSILDRFDETITSQRDDRCWAYRLRKTKPLKKRKNYECEFAYRDRGRLLRAVSRPGVFSHRRIDPGARHLINTMQVESSMRVIDIGCGSGTVSIAAAAAAEDVQVYSIDSHSRAIQCTQRGAELNELENITAHLTDRGEIDSPGTYDLALANPPYYADFRIAELFLETAFEALHHGGRVYVVGKHSQWYQENMSRWFRSIEITQTKGYIVVTGVKA